MNAVVRRSIGWDQIPPRTLKLNSKANPGPTAQLERWLKPSKAVAPRTSYKRVDGRKSCSRSETYLFPTFRYPPNLTRLSHFSFPPLSVVGAVAPYPVPLFLFSFTYQTMSTQQSPDRDFEKQSFDEPADQLMSAQKDTNDLPSPVSAQVPRSKPKVSAAAIIPVWIVLSSAVILYNNHLYSTLNFRYPVFLVTWHLTFAVSPTPR